MKKISKFMFVVSLVMSMINVIDTVKATENYEITIVGTNYQSEARKIFEMVNKERQKAGVQPLSWNNELEQATLIRAAETSAYFSHTRPDGSQYYTVNSKINGENIAMGYMDPQQVFEGWMNSDGHRRNILNKNFKSFAVAEFKMGNVPYWVQLFSVVESNDSVSSTIANDKSVTRNIKILKSNIGNLTFNERTPFQTSKGYGGNFKLKFVNIGTERTVCTLEMPLKWETSNSQIVSVDQGGNWKALRGGNSTITASVLKYPELSASKTIEVQSALKGLQIVEGDQTIKVGESKTLHVSYNPQDTTSSKELTWSSSNPTVVKVDSTGRITALSEGTATISVDSKYYYNVTDRIKVTVRKGINTPVLNSIKVDGNKAKLSWSNVLNATGYNIYQYNETKNTWDYLKGTTGTSTTISNINEGKLQYFKVRAFSKGTEMIYSNYSNTKSVVVLQDVTVQKIMKNGNGIYLEWSESLGASAYNIYRYNEKTRHWDYLKATTGTNTTDKSGATFGKEYYYKVRPFKKANNTVYYGAYSETATGLILPKGSLTDISNSYRSIKLGWSKAAGARGYNVYRYDAKTDAWNYIRSITDGRNFTDTNLTSGRRYYYKVRPYKKLKDGTVVYGDYSNTLSGVAR